MSQLSNRWNPSVQAFLPNVTAGVIAGIIAVAYALAFSALLFSGSLSPYTGFAATLGLITSLVGNGIVAVWSSRPGSILIVQDAPAMMLALAIGSIVQEINAADTQNTPIASLLATAIATVALCTLLNGGMLYGLGYFKLGNFMRYIPYPVIGGFLAGTGWLLSFGALMMMTGLDDLTQWEYWGQPTFLMQWVPGVLFAAILFQLSRRFTYVWLTPGIVLGSIALFYLVLLLAGGSLDAAQGEGLLFAPPPPQSGAEQLTLSSISQIHWGIMLRHSGDFLAICVISILAFLLNLSGIEMAIAKEFDLNHELRVTGAANLASGLGGGMIGFHGVGLTTLCSGKMGGQTRLVGLIAAALCGISLISGPALITFIPKFVLGGLVLYVGLDFLDEWVVKARHRFSVFDYGCILAILFTIATVGALPGIGIGLAITVAAFVFRYSQFSTIKYELSGASHHSNVARPLRQYQLLREQGDQIWILSLQGFIFFGTAHTLLSHVKERVSKVSTDDVYHQTHANARSHSPAVKFIVLDFSHVVNIDSSALLSFTKMASLAAQHNITLVFTHLSPAVQQVLHQNKQFVPDASTLQFFPDLDRGLEWCENELINARWRRSRFVPMNFLLRQIFPDDDGALAFREYLQQIQVQAGETIFAEGDRADNLYCIESGQVSEFLPLSEEMNRRLLTSKSGTFVGAIAFCTGSPHQTTAIADQDSSIYVLSRERLSQMIQETPRLAATFQDFMATRLAEQLAQANQTMKMLLS